MSELSIIQATILGIVQGASEFLPISSSGHLVIFQQLLGVNLESGPMVAFDVCLHIGTLLAVIVALRVEVWEILKGIFKRPPLRTSDSQTEFAEIDSMRIIWLLVLGTIPAVIIGFSFKDFFESLFSSILPVGIALFITGCILFATRFVHLNLIKLNSMKWWHSVVIGCAQALAIFPGISRSGSTIAAGLFARLDRSLAAKFSFLLSIPAIAGAAVLQFDNLKYLSLNNLLATLIGTTVSFLVGFISVRWMLSVVKGGKFHFFAYYCWLVGFATIMWSLFSN